MLVSQETFEGDSLAPLLELGPLETTLRDRGVARQARRQLSNKKNFWFRGLSVEYVEPKCLRKARAEART